MLYVAQSYRVAFCNGIALALDFAMAGFCDGMAQTCRPIIGPRFRVKPNTREKNVIRV